MEDILATFVRLNGLFVVKKKNRFYIVMFLSKQIIPIIY